MFTHPKLFSLGVLAVKSSSVAEVFQMGLPHGGALHGPTASPAISQSRLGTPDSQDMIREVLS
jgi:hypothetical protein